MSGNYPKSCWLIITLRSQRRPQTFFGFSTEKDEKPHKVERRRRKTAITTLRVFFLFSVASLFPRLPHTNQMSKCERWSSRPIDHCNSLGCNSFEIKLSRLFVFLFVPGRVKPKPQNMSAILLRQLVTRETSWLHTTRKTVPTSPYMAKRPNPPESSFFLSPAK